MAHFDKHQVIQPCTKQTFTPNIKNFDSPFRISLFSFMALVEFTKQNLDFIEQFGPARGSRLKTTA